MKISLEGLKSKVEQVEEKKVSKDEDRSPESL